MSSNKEARLLTVDEVAALLGFHRQTVYEKVASGEIPHIRIGRTVRFDQGELRRWLSDRTERAA